MTEQQMAFFHACVSRKRKIRFLKGLTVCILVVLTIVSIAGFFKARKAEKTAEQERDRAVKQKNLALKAVNVLTYDLADELAKIPRAQNILKQILQTNTELLEEISALNPDTTEAQREKASNLSRAGDNYLLMGNLEEAVKAYQQCSDIFKKLADANPNDTDAQRNLSVSFEKLGDVNLQLGDTQSALKSYQDSHEILAKLAESDPANTQAQSDWMKSLVRIGILQPDSQSKKEYLEKALAIAEELAEKDKYNQQAQKELNAVKEIMKLLGE